MNARNIRPRSTPYSIRGIFRSCTSPPNAAARLKSFEELLALLRALSRRDLTVAETHVITFLGALPVWMAGSDDQKQLAARLIRAAAKSRSP